MTTNGLRVNENKCRIEMTKEFAKKAQFYGTDEYKDLQNVKKDYPNFKVMTVATKNTNKYRGLTIDGMKAVIEKYGTDEQKAKFHEFLADDEFSKALGLKKASVSTIAKWFMSEMNTLKEAFDKKKAEENNAEEINAEETNKAA